MKILCVDPGKTTGLSILEVGKTTPPKQCDWMQVTGGVDGFINFMYEQFNLYFEADLIICESFKARDAWIDPEPLLVIGALKAINTAYIGANLVLQQPSAAIPNKKTKQGGITDEVLERLGLMGDLGHANRHQRDATRHGVVYLRNIGHTPTIEKGWPHE